MSANFLKRWQQRRQTKRAYEAAKASHYHPFKRDSRNGDGLLQEAGETLRDRARYLDQNHDIARGVLNTLVAKIVGAKLLPEPQVKNSGGELSDGVNQRLLNLFKDWCYAPDVTGELHWHTLCRLVCRSWLRDGEVLVKFVEGEGHHLEHGTRVPFSLECIESDCLPYNTQPQAASIHYGVEKNAWGRPLAYHLYTTHPGDIKSGWQQTTKRIPANRLCHVKLIDRIGQTRGVSVFASVFHRLEDLKDYEESERIAARIAAAMTMYIHRDSNSPNLFTPSHEQHRQFEMGPGMMIDNLLPGESINTIQSNRPNALMGDFRETMLRAVAAGTSSSYSSISKNYNGTYSSQRQELVEQSDHYNLLRDEFIEGFVRPVWRRFVRLAIAADLVAFDEPIDLETVDDAYFQTPVTPWIDPKKEADANKILHDLGVKSLAKIIREQGGNPQDVFAQLQREPKKTKFRRC